MDMAYVRANIRYKLMRGVVALVMTIENYGFILLLYNQTLENTSITEKLNR